MRYLVTTGLMMFAAILPATDASAAMYHDLAITPAEAYAEYAETFPDVGWICAFEGETFIVGDAFAETQPALDVNESDHAARVLFEATALGSPTLAAKAALRNSVPQLGTADSGPDLALMNGVLLHPSYPSAGDSGMPVAKDIDKTFDGEIHFNPQTEAEPVSWTDQLPSWEETTPLLLACLSGLMSLSRGRSSAV